MTMACQSTLAAVRIISGSLFINSGTCSKDRQLRCRMPITNLRPSFLSDPTVWTNSGSAMSESVTKGNTSFRWRMNLSIAAESDLSAVDAQSITSDFRSYLRRVLPTCRVVGVASGCNNEEVNICRLRCTSYVVTE